MAKSQTPAVNDDATDNDDDFDFEIVAVDPTERPKRTGRGGKSLNMDRARQILATILSGKDVSDGKEYAADDEHTADENARRIAVKAARYLTAALAENPQVIDGKTQVAGTRIKGGHWYLFLTNPREKRAPATVEATATEAPATEATEATA